MARTSNGYLDPDSFERGWKQYDKTREFWEKTRFFAIGTIILGALIMPILAFNSYLRPGRQTPAHLVVPFMILDGAIMVTCALLIAAISLIVKHRQLKYPTRSLMLHAMKEMGIQHPTKVLATNPRYLEAYDEVKATFLRIEANETRKSKRHESLSSHSHHVASLVLRDGRSLALTPLLISLIKADHMMSYESLAGELDNHTPATTKHPE